MKVINFNRENIEKFRELLEEAKAALLSKFVRHINGEVNIDGSVIRYNMAREELKSEYPLEVIGMLDASGFIKKVLSHAERAWLRARKMRAMSPSEAEKFLAWEKKGGQS